MTPSESKVVQFLARYGLHAEKREEGDQPNPDFDVTKGDAFYCLVEVKAIEGPGETEAMLWQSLYNRVSNDIRKAADQFTAVNSKHLVPTVMVLVAEDFRIHAQSFLDFLNGEIRMDAVQLACLRRYRFGRVTTAFPAIDLFILLEKSGTAQFFFNMNDGGFLMSLSRAFGIHFDAA